MEKHNFGKQFRKRFDKVMKFQQNKGPLLILVTGTFCMAKQNLANFLPEILNVSNIMSTKIVGMMHEACDFNDGTQLKLQQIGY